MNWITKEIVMGIVQILGGGVAVIGATNLVALLVSAWRESQTITDFYPMKITMAMPTALALLMTGICLVLLTIKVKPKTQYRRDAEVESP